MISTSTINDRLQRAFRPTQHGVIGLTEQFLAACIGADLEIKRVGDRCVCLWTEGGNAEQAPLPIPPAAFRTILARVAALCNERSPGSVSPYGGEARLAVGEAEVFVKFVNTPQAQELQVKNDRSGNGVPPSKLANVDATADDVVAK